MPRKHPPLPSDSRPAYRKLRLFAVVLVLTSTALAIVFASNGLGLTAAMTFLAGALFAAVVWTAPTSHWVVPLMVVLGVVISILSRSWWITAVVISILVWVIWSRTRLGSLPTEFESVAADSVMTNAEEFVASFRSMGFEQVAAYRARGGRVPVVVSLLISPDGRSYAAVTDAALNVTSLFPDGRWLVTRNHNVLDLPSEMLINPSPGAEPDQMAASHEAALTVLAGHGYRPTKVEPGALPGIEIASERRVLEWLEGRSRIPSPKDRTSLASRPDREERIAAWASAGI